VELQYAHRLFWLVCPYQYRGSYRNELHDLRAQVFAAPGATVYPLFFDFKRFVLEPALKELNELH
jgi:plasmid replication initiation protein